MVTSSASLDSFQLDGFRQRDECHPCNTTVAERDLSFETSRGTLSNNRMDFTCTWSQRTDLDGADLPTIRLHSTTVRVNDTFEGASSLTLDKGQTEEHSSASIPIPASAPKEWVESDRQIATNNGSGRACAERSNVIDRSKRTRRRRSRSQSTGSPLPASTFLRAGDRVTVIEDHSPTRSDFDWYDKDGLRVRVREI